MDHTNSEDIINTTVIEEVEQIPGSIGDIIIKYITFKLDSMEQTQELNIYNIDKLNTQEEIDRLTNTDNISEIFDAPINYPIELLDKYSLNLPIKEYVLDNTQKINLVSKFSIGMLMFTNIRIKYIDLESSIQAISKLINMLEITVLAKSENLIINHLRPGCVNQPSKFNHKNNLQIKTKSQISKTTIKRNNNKREINIVKCFNDIKIIIDLLNGKSYSSYNLNLELNIVIDRLRNCLYKYLDTESIDEIEYLITTSGDMILSVYYSTIYINTLVIKTNLRELLNHTRYSLDEKIIPESDDIKVFIPYTIEKIKILHERISNIDKDLDTSIINMIEIIHSILMLLGKIYKNKIYYYQDFRQAIELADRNLYEIDNLVIYLGNAFSEELDEYFQTYSGNSKLVKSMIENNLTIYDLLTLLKSGIYDLLSKLLIDHVVT